MAHGDNTPERQNPEPTGTRTVDRFRATDQEGPTMTTASLDPLLKPKEAAAYVGISLSTFYHLRYQGESHPPAIRVGKHLRYRKSGLDAWLDAQTEQPAVAK